jgi:hypothetical protein
MGIGDDPSSPSPHHRARRRPVAGRRALDLLPARLLPARARALAPVPQALPRRLSALHAAGRLAFHGDLADLAEADAFAAMLAPLRRADWVVYAKRPFGGPEAVLAYLARYTHRVAIANSRLVAMDRHGVTFRWKDYRARSAGKTWRKTMTLTAPEFIRRFLLHVLPDGFHRIRHYGLLASSRRAETIARIRQIIAAPTPAPQIVKQRSAERSDPVDERRPPCPCCGGRMILVERFAPGTAAHHPRRQDRHLMTMAPGDTLTDPTGLGQRAGDPVRARSRKWTLRRSGSSQAQQTRASGHPGRASRRRPRLALTRRPGGAAKSP